ncbi:Dynactin 2 p50 subunit [Carabus blaptoides fortunei]
MADPKYANLPGIAYDQPDVYETTDLPEADQKSDFFEDEKDPVERLHISATEAFNKFKGKSLDSNLVDFSDRISKRTRIGYDARTGDWELVPEGQKETPLQKYQRLQCEMKELLEEVSELKSSDETSEQQSSCLVTNTQVDQSLKQLYDLRLEDALGSEIIGNLTDPQGIQINKLLAQLEHFKQSTGTKPVPTAVLDAPSDSIVYQLHYRPERTRLEQTTRLSELEHRLHRLENVLGASSENLARLATATQQHTLYDAAQELSAKASLLDSAQLDHIEGRLTALQQKMNTVATQKAATVEDAEQDQMIVELYELVKKSENLSQVLPETIERLIALESLHNRATEFSKSLAQLEALQAQITAGVQNNKSLLQGVQESFAINLDNINKSIVSLDGRIKALKK